MEKSITNDNVKKDIIVLDYMVMGKEKVDHEHVSLLCSTEVDSLLIKLSSTKYVLKYLLTSKDNSRRPF